MLKLARMRLSLSSSRPRPTAVDKSWSHTPGALRTNPSPAVSRYEAFAAVAPLRLWGRRLGWPLMHLLPASSTLVGHPSPLHQIAPSPTTSTRAPPAGSRHLPPT